MGASLSFCPSFLGVLSQACVTPTIHTDGVAVRMNAQRQPSAAPLATSTDRHERWCATTPHDRAQVRGRASGVRCKAMLGRRHEPHDMRKNMLNKGDAFSKTGNVKFASLDLVLVPTLLFRYHFERLREFETKISLTILFQNHILLAPKYFQIRSL